MAEIEIGILDRQRLGRQIGNQHYLKTEVEAWEQRRHAAGRQIQWTFSRQDAAQKLGRHYVT